MNERTPILDALCHLILVIGAIAVCLPIYFVFVIGSMSQLEITRVPLSWLPSDQFVANVRAVVSNANFGRLLLNSLVVAVGITIGKLSMSIIAAFAVTYFRFRFRLTAFWLIFMSLMLPIEVRIVPTYESAANVALPLNIIGEWFGIDVLVGLDWNMVNTYSGLILPLIASATATFLFRQFFMTVPDELVEATKIDGAGPMRFFRDVLIPLSRTNIAALFVILFIYGWNQYLWPLLITTQESFYTVVMAVSRQATAVDATPSWNLLMAMAMLAMLPPVLVVVFMQRQFVRGLVETEK